MGLRKLKRKLQMERRLAEDRFRRHRNANRLAPPGPHDFVIVLDHLKPGYNIGKIFRSADAFGAREVHLVGIEFFDPAPAMGSFKWVPARFQTTFEDCRRELTARGYTLLCLEPQGGRPLPEADLPRKSAFIFGHEEYGLSFDRRLYPEVLPVTIPQVGRVQSLNVSIAASVVMWEYLRRHGASRPAAGPGARPPSEVLQALQIHPHGPDADDAGGLVHLHTEGVEDPPQKDVHPPGARQEDPLLVEEDVPPGVGLQGHAE